MWGALSQIRSVAAEAASAAAEAFREEEADYYEDVEVQNASETPLSGISFLTYSQIP